MATLHGKYISKLRFFKSFKKKIDRVMVTKERIDCFEMTPLCHLLREINSRNVLRKLKPSQNVIWSKMKNFFIT